MFLRDSCNLSSKRSGHFAKNSFHDLLEMIMNIVQKMVKILFQIYMIKVHVIEEIIK